MLVIQHYAMALVDTLGRGSVGFAAVDENFLESGFFLLHNLVQARLPDGYSEKNMNNPLSYSSVKLDLFSKDGVRLKPASGFVIEAKNQYYLITNWHVLSGKRIATSDLQEPFIKPFTLKTSIHIHGGRGEGSDPFSKGIRKGTTIHLYDDKDAPRWTELRANEPHRPTVDLVALPIQLNMDLDRFMRTITGTKTKNDVWSQVSAIPISAIDTDVEYGPADPVHIIGYPLGWAPAGIDKSSSAFWRASWIASEMKEPGLIQANGFFIDPCALEGMTGSPVVGMKNERLKLLGIYSDSPAGEFSANAGLVWDAGLLKQLIRTS